jgi:hypothetical protein
MNDTSYFERLVASVERIARHIRYPGIDQSVNQCLEDIDDLMRAELISPEQREALRFVLLGIMVNAA